MRRTGESRWRACEADLAQSAKDGQNLSRSFADHASRTLEGIDLILTGIEERLGNEHAGGAIAALSYSAKKRPCGARGDCHPNGAPDPAEERVRPLAADSGPEEGGRATIGGPRRAGRIAAVNG